MWDCDLPYATRRQDNDLNRAYAFLSEPTFGQAARALVDKLVAMGFEAEEARDSIEATLELMDDDSDLISPRDIRKPVFEFEISSTPETLAALRETKSMTVRETEDWKAEISIAGYVSEELEHEIVGKLPEAERNGFADAVARHRCHTGKLLTPAERGEPFDSH